MRTPFTAVEGEVLSPNVTATTEKNAQISPFPLILDHDNFIIHHISSAVFEKSFFFTSVRISERSVGVLGG